MRDYFFYGATVGEIRYMLETLPMPAGTVDAEVLDRLDRLALITSQLTERKEFPEAARACAGRLLKLAEAHATRKAMDETARREAGICARQIGQAFL